MIFMGKRKNKKKKKKTTITNGQNYNTKPKSTVTKSNYTHVVCHTGNRPAFEIGEGENRSLLYAGGWSRKVAPRREWAVIDLTGEEWPNVEYSDVEAKNYGAEQMFGNALNSVSARKAGPWLSLPIRDFGVPYHLNRDFWYSLADDIEALAESKTNVLVACLGGHGRTGMVVAILMGILRPDLAKDDPIQATRDLVCEKCVETEAQAAYVFDMLDMDMPTGKYTWAGFSRYSYGGTSGRYAESYDSKGDNYLYDSTKGWVKVDGQMEEVEPEAKYKPFGVTDPTDTVCQTCKGYGYIESDDLDISSYTTELCPHCAGWGTL